MLVWTTNDLVAKMIEGYQANQSLKYPQASHLQSNGLLVDSVNLAFKSGICFFIFHFLF